jgi:magnesium transporter
MPETKTIKSKKLTWLNIINPSDQEISYLKKKYNFYKSDLDDSTSHKHSQRLKVIIRPKYVFMVLLFPVYNRHTRNIKPAEIDIFISKNHLITLHNNKLLPLKNFFQELESNKNDRDLYLNDTSAMLMYEILERIYKSIFPMLDHISINMNVIEKNIFRGNERENVKEILTIKRNIVSFRKIMQVHKNQYKKLISQKNSQFANNETVYFYNNLIDYTKNIWDILENHQQTISALEDTNNTLVTFKLNDVMKTLTMFSVIVFPLTLFAAIFAMRADAIPIIGSHLDFWKIIGLMALIAFTMLTIFKRKKWF